MRRRWCEGEVNGVKWKDVFTGKGIDVGCGDDKLPFDDCIGFDQKDGDGNDLTKYFKAGTFDYLHSSQCLEHLINPVKALESWIAVVKKGGGFVITVPSWELYEGMIWPSRFNPDHRSTWSLWQKSSPAPIHIYVPDFLASFINVEVKLCRLVDTNYDYKVGTSRDQTWREDEQVEAFIEFLLYKK